MTPLILQGSANALIHCGANGGEGRLYFNNDGLKRNADLECGIRSGTGVRNCCCVTAVGSSYD